MATFVLVPGAWLGGWCWSRVRPLLRQAGHDVYTPTLTGLGERAHLATPDVGLETHIQDVVNVLFYEDLSDVILVGHSYAGFVITGVAQQVPERISQLVYLAAVVPQVDGDSLFRQAPEFEEHVRRQAGESGEGWRWPLPPFEEIERFSTMHGLSPEDQAWFRSNAVPQPVKTFAGQLASHETPPLRETYIRCTGDYGSPPAMTQGEGWRYRELDTGHWPMFTKPAALAELLLALA